jgi:hypothetical protein
MLPIKLKRKPYIVVRLMGGLGNQLFMYAFAKSLSIKNSIPLKLDIKSGFTHDKTYKRNYLLNHFMIEDEITSNWESYEHILGRRRRKLIISFNKFLPLMKRMYISEQIRAFDEDIYNMTIEKPVYFDGYWQSYKYFDNIDETIRKNFSVRFPLTTEELEEASRIKGCNAICLGIRRFADMPERRRSKLKILDFEYFQKAIRIIEESCLDPHFFIFTQDRIWAEQNFSKQSNITFIRSKDPHRGAAVDLHLMTLCKHHIISNSTLHWWGAWLNANPDKIIIAPNSGWGAKDIVPLAWKTIDC